MIDGTITAESERKQIQALLKPKKQASTPTPKPKPLTAFEELHLEVMRLRERLVTEARENPDAVKALAAALAAIVQDAQDLALFAELAEKTTRSDVDRSPLAELEPVAAPDPDSVRPIEDAPPTAPSEANHGSPKPYVADTRTPDEIIGEMPAWMRRAKPSPSIAPEALQELIDAGIDPDEAAERLQEQIERWS